MTYNEKNNEIAIAPMAFPVWDSNRTTETATLFDTLPFLTPYELHDSITLDGIYTNISFAFHIVLLCEFLKRVSVVLTPNHYELETQDMCAYLGKKRASIVNDSVLSFLKNGISTECVERDIIKPSQKDIKPFPTVGSIMSTLRKEYNDLVEKRGTVVGVRYFLSYDELFSRYTGRASLMKWIDILCDQGGLVARNTQENGVYFRACRSGECDPDHSEKKTSVLLAVAINSCGKKTEDGKGFRIGTTYFNKLLANLVFDYPQGQGNDFHNLCTKPYLHGPLTYAQCKLDDEQELSIYKIGAISEFCAYNREDGEFLAASSQAFPKLQEQISECFSDRDAVALSTILVYFEFLKTVQEKYGNADVLNQMAICRNEDVYYQHVLFDIKTSLNDIKQAMTAVTKAGRDEMARNAATVAKSALTKLKYDPSSLLEELKNIATQKMLFSDVFKK